jgi:hypothetical protein
MRTQSRPRLQASVPLPVELPDARRGGVDAAACGLRFVRSSLFGSVRSEMRGAVELDSTGSPAWLRAALISPAATLGRRVREKTARQVRRPDDQVLAMRVLSRRWSRS